MACNLFLSIDPKTFIHPSNMPVFKKYLRSNGRVLVKSAIRASPFFLLDGLLVCLDVMRGTGHKFFRSFLT